MPDAPTPAHLRAVLHGAEHAAEIARWARQVEEGRYTAELVRLGWTPPGAARPAPVWDEAGVTEAVAAALADHAPDLDETAVFLGTCDCGWRVTVPAPFPSEEEHTAHVATAVLAVVRERLPVKPGRETVLLTLARADGQDWESIADASLHTAEIMYGAQATAVLDLWPGRSEAVVKREAWDEGAKAAWESSGEGWNGEYPPDTKHDVRNPYREGGAS